MIYLDNNFFEYVTIGEFRTDREWIHPERSIDSYELILVLEGTVELEEDGNQYCLSSDEMIILEPGRVHRGVKLSEPPTAFYWFHFRTDITMPFKTYSGNDVYDVKMLLKKLLHVANTPAYPSGSADAAALMIFQELCVCGGTSEPVTALACRIAEYIRINIDDGVTVSRVAEHFGYHADYLGKIFKKSFKLGIKEYISAQKINKAKSLLVSTDMSVKQISAALGYGDENLFVKFFKYHEEISPTGFRNLYKGTHMNNK
ncbi:MAG: helix-turn-helix transcriptional regulator [Clostridia bacterium]|nr:helix-turn-helix transcriptional regulator [Clostridia bacterium]